MICLCIKVLKNISMKIEDVMSVVINSIQNYVWILHNKTLLMLQSMYFWGFSQFYFDENKESSFRAFLVLVMSNKYLKYNADKNTMQPIFIGIINPIVHN